MKKEFEKFLKSDWGLNIWLGNKIIFRSKKSGVKGLLDFLHKFERKHKDIIIFDKIVGRAAALLSIYANAKEVYAELGSKTAAGVFKKYKIKFYFKKICANILNKNKTDLCPMEKLSFKKTPEDMYEFLNKNNRSK